MKEKEKETKNEIEIEKDKEEETKNEIEIEIEKETKNDLENTTVTKEAGKEEQVIILRPLNMDDMRQAKNQVNICSCLNFEMWDEGSCRVV